MKPPTTSSRSYCKALLYSQTDSQDHLAVLCINLSLDPLQHAAPQYIRLILILPLSVTKNSTCCADFETLTIEGIKIYYYTQKVDTIVQRLTVFGPRHWLMNR